MVMRQLIPSSSEFWDCATLSMHSITQRHIAMCETHTCSVFLLLCGRTQPNRDPRYLPHFFNKSFYGFHYKGNFATLFLIKHNIVKTYGGEVFFVMYLTWSLGGLSVQRHPRPLCRPEKMSQYALHSALRVPQSRSGSCRQEKGILPLPKIEPRFFYLPA